jgi:23S rRNA pseudouridine1911/1915/1917 synthase
MIATFASLILFEDEDILLINKPAGVIVNDSETAKTETLQTAFRNYLAAQPQKTANWQSLVPKNFDESYGSPEEIWQERQGLVHRLDKDTSGIMIWAKNPGALLNLLQQFKQRETQKQYLLLCHGHFSIQEGQIQASLARASHDRLKYQISADGRAALTEYTVKETFSGQDLIPSLVSRLRQERDQNEATAEQKAKADVEKLARKKRLETKLMIKRLENTYQAGFSLVAAWPKTGRTHQIRVHFAAQQHPLVADQLYLGRNRAKLDLLWCPRQFLHASELRFRHPRSAEQMTFQAALAADLQQALATLKKL